ncbi:MAG: DUF1552 domain-containing protein [Deltaproteobacteria bacterium]|nr:DUF1552 domain-containing protein [Deltaproteobacteria bacterium]
MPFVSRRSLLRGLALGASTSMFRPLLKEFIREARGEAGPAKRLAFVFGQYSFPRKYMDPKIRTATDFDLNPATSPLAPFKSELTLIRNLGAPQGPGANGGHGQDEGVYLGLGTQFGWTGSDWATNVGKDGTIDRFIGKRIGASDKFSSLSFRPGGRPLLPVDYTSWDGDDQPYPAFATPLDAYDKIFGGAMLPPGAPPVDTTALLKQDQSLLDFTVGEIKVLESRLAAPEKEKLGKFTESLRAVEKKLTAVAMAPVVSCENPAKPAATLARQQAVEAQVDIAAMALACGLSHVSAMNVGPDNHDANHEDAPSVGTDNTWRLQQTAKLFGKLKELGLGDSSLVLYSDSNGLDHHGGRDQGYFYWVLGGLGGRLKTGRILDLPASRPYLGDFYVSLANLMGLQDVSRFGLPELSKGALTAFSG